MFTTIMMKTRNEKGIFHLRTRCIQLLVPSSFSVNPKSWFLISKYNSKTYRKKMFALNSLVEFVFQK